MQHNLKQIAQFVKPTAQGFILFIPVNSSWNGVSEQHIEMHVARDPHAVGSYDGDLAVHWDASNMQNTGGGNMGTLLMRGANDEVGRTMGRFYWDSEFDSHVNSMLHAAGFDASMRVTGSEWGMQDEGRASYDAYDVADAVRAAMHLQA